MGGGHRGGAALRTVGRAMARTGVSAVAGGGGGGLQESLSSSTINGSASSTSRSISPRRTHLSSPVPPISSCNKNAIPGIPIWNSGSKEFDECEWVDVGGIEDGGVCGYGFHGHCLLENAPCQDEVEDAVFALQHAFGTVKHARDKYNYEMDKDGSEPDWLEPSLTPYRSRTLETQGSEGVHYAFHLLQTDSSVQRMVKSLSSDKAVWDAVLNNEAVRELGESIFEDEEHSSESLDGTSEEAESHTTGNIVMQIFHTAKAKFTEVIEKITMIMNDMFGPENQKTSTEAEAEPWGRFNETLRIGFMLSIVVMLVLVVSRRVKWSKA